VRPARQTEARHDVEYDEEAGIGTLEDESLEYNGNTDPSDKVCATDTNMPRSTVSLVTIITHMTLADFRQPIASR
jgi:hypothetical protein